VSDNRLKDANQRYQEQMERLASSRALYALVGAFGGIALAVLALIESSVQSKEVYPGARGVLLLAAGALFGLVVGLDLHSTRTWRRFGKYTFAFRFMLASSAGGTATGIAGVLLGMVAGADLWKYSAGGALLGLLLLIWRRLERIG
jgi:hypothetical protein